MRENLAPEAYAEQLLIVTWLTHARAGTTAPLTLRCGPEERLMLAEVYRRAGSSLKQFACILRVVILHLRWVSATTLATLLKEMLDDSGRLKALLDAPTTGEPPPWWWDTKQIGRRFEHVVETESKRGTLALLLRR